jgi:P-type Ca2+ transporter type 2C
LRVDPPIPPPAASSSVHTGDVTAVVRGLAVDPAVGLSALEAEARLARHGRNELATGKPTSRLVLFARQFRSLLILVLVVAAVLAALVGELVDAVVVAGVLLMNATLGYVQEQRATRSIDALAGMLATRARVRRDGRLIEVPGAELVPGDVVLVEAGDRVPADGRLVEAAVLAADESSLTGESVPAEKDAVASLAEDAPLAEQSTMLWMNTTVVRGRGALVVTATGMETHVGRVAGMLAEAPPRPTPLQRQLDVLGRRLTAVAGAAVTVVLALGLVQGDGLADAALDAIVLAIAAIPEGLPAVVALTLAVGSSRMARRNAIVRRLSAVETLGSCDVICTDKTGTLTRNEMTAQALWRAGRHHAVTGHGYGLDGEVQGDPGDLEVLATALVRCNDADVVDHGVVGDPTEGALLVLAAKAGADLGAVRAADRLDELPFDSATRLMATVHADGRGGTSVAVKGAPDAVLPHCSRWVGPAGVTSLDAAATEELRGAIETLAGDGLRVLAVATRRLPGDPTGQPEAAALVDELTLEALVGLADPPRPGVADAIADARRAGIQVTMITGDHPATAASIAAQVGIPGEVVTGADLDRMDDEELVGRVERLGVCARVAPEHKVRLVAAFQARGRVTAMTGDGVNDAPALESADIGVAMGRGGTEVTREAAALVLADDDFTTIVAAVERGRAIYDNIVAFVRFQLATNIGAILTILVARALGLPTPFTPIQILWVNLIMDGPPALALGVDPARPDTMTRRPRAPGAQLLDRARLWRLVLTGAVMGAGTLLVFGHGLRTGDTALATTLAFTTFVLFQVGNALNARTERTSILARHTLRNRPLWLALTSVVTLQVVAVQLPWLRDIVDTRPLTWRQWLLAAAVASSVLVVEELRKQVERLVVARREAPR